MRTKFEIVDDPKIINAQLLEFRQPKDTPKEKQERLLRIKITTDKIKVGNMLDPNKIKNKESVIINLSDRRLYMSYQRKPYYINLKTIRCVKNRKTRYKDFLYLLRNPHAALLYVNSDIQDLKTLAMKIIQGYKIIFPREVRYYGGLFSTT